MRSESIFIKELAKNEIISPSEQLDLLTRWKTTNDRRALDRLYASIIKIIPKIASSLRPPKSPHYMDLVQEGNIAVYKSLKSYDIEKHTTSVYWYATYLAKKAMLNFLLSNDKPVRIKGSQYIYKAIKLLKKDPTNEEIYNYIRETNMNEQQFLAAIEKVRTSKKINTSEDVVCEQSPDPEKAALFNDCAEKAKQAITNIENLKYKNIVEEYFFDNQTMQTIGDRHGIAKQRVQQIISQQIKSIRKKMN